MKNPKSILKVVERLSADLEAIREFLVEVIEQKNTIEKEIYSEDYVCLYCKQPVATGKDLVRGIHKASCYHEARRRVAEGNTTWEALEKANLILPVGATKLGRPKSSKLSKTEIERLKKLASKNSGRKSS